MIKVPRREIERREREKKTKTSQIFERSPKVVPEVSFYTVIKSRIREEESLLRWTGKGVMAPSALIGPR